MCIRRGLFLAHTEFLGEVSRGVFHGCEVRVYPIIREPSCRTSGDRSCRFSRNCLWSIRRACTQGGPKSAPYSGDLEYCRTLSSRPCSCIAAVSPRRDSQYCGILLLCLRYPAFFRKSVRACIDGYSESGSGYAIWRTAAYVRLGFGRHRSFSS